MSDPNLAPVVYVIDDDAAIRQSIGSLLRSVGITVHTFASSADFIVHTRSESPGCIVLDVRLQAESGLEFQGRLAGLGINMPVVFISGYGDIAMSVKAMKAGAQDFLVKPFREQDLLDAINSALDRSRAQLRLHQARGDMVARYQSLSAREREVMDYAVHGMMNKQIAARLGLSEITVKLHRRNAMRKMAAKTFADLVKLSVHCVESLAHESG
jgi:FixJ family two-component response regulator